MEKEKEETVVQELSVAALEALVDEGLFGKVEGHKEHLALSPYWLSVPSQGAKEEVRHMLGKWNRTLSAYLVGFDSLLLLSKTGAMNEDHQWIHVDVGFTAFLYQPKEGQVLKGEIKKLGSKAAMCVLFNVFSATVFPSSDDEFQAWEMGSEIIFTVHAFQNRRKGPVIKGRSIGAFGFSPLESEETLTPSKKQKKKKKQKVEEESEEVWE